MLFRSAPGRQNQKSSTARAAAGSVLSLDIAHPVGRLEQRLHQAHLQVVGQLHVLHGQRHAAHPLVALAGADFERQVARRADLCTFVSEAEAQLFRTASGLGQGKIQALENGVKLDFFDPDADFALLSAEERGAGPLMVFTGQMDYRPNVEAVDSFACEVMPQILARHPDARFAIVGRNPTPQVQGLADLPGVIVTGGVPDVRPWLAAADVVVAPLRIARGIQNKVLEAMAMARPVVASAQAAEGIDAVEDRDFLVADGVDREAEMVLALLDDPQRANAIGAAARDRMVARYGWDAVLSGLPSLIGGSTAQDMQAA